MAIQFFGQCGKDKKNRRAKVNFLYKKKKTTTKFSFASVPLLANLAHSSWGTPRTKMWNTLVSNRSFQLSYTHFLAVEQTPAEYHYLFLAFTSQISLLNNVWSECCYLFKARHLLPTNLIRTDIGQGSCYRINMNVQHLEDFIMCPPSRLLLIYLFKRNSFSFFVTLHSFHSIYCQQILVFLSSLQRTLQGLMPYSYINIKLTG